MEMNGSLKFKVRGSDWIVTLQNIEGEEITNIILQRGNGKAFHATMVDDYIITPEGEKINFRQLMLIEHDSGKDKVGDVVIQFRQNPHTGRYKVQVEEENVFITEDSESVIKIWRATRSGVDNIAQAVKKQVSHSGWVYANPRRIGGNQIKTHYVIAGWAPQLASQMMDVYDYVQSLDSLGLASFLKALQHMPDSPAQSIFNQLRTPPLQD